MTFRQGLRFTLSYLCISFILCVCVGAFLYLSNMVGEPLFQLQLTEGLTVRFFGMEGSLPAHSVEQLLRRAGQLFYFLPPYGRFALRILCSCVIAVPVLV